MPWAREAAVTGTFPEVSLAKARVRREDPRRLIADNACSGVAKQAEKNVGADTFRVIATEWLSKQHLARATLDDAWVFEQLLLPELGDRFIRGIAAPELFGVLRKIEGRGAVETDHRAKQRARCFGTQLRRSVPRTIPWVIYVVL